MEAAYIVYCPKTGIHLRTASEEEKRAYLAQPVRCPEFPEAFRKPVKVGDVMVDIKAEALWQGGAGF